MTLPDLLIRLGCFLYGHTPVQIHGHRRLVSYCIECGALLSEAQLA